MSGLIYLSMAILTGVRLNLKEDIVCISQIAICTGLYVNTDLRNSQSNCIGHSVDTSVQMHLQPTDVKDLYYYIGDSKRNGQIPWLIPHTKITLTYNKWIINNNNTEAVINAHSFKTAEKQIYSSKNSVSTHTHTYTHTHTHTKEHTHTHTKQKQKLTLKLLKILLDVKMKQGFCGYYYQLLLFAISHRITLVVHTVIPYSLQFWSILPTNLSSPCHIHIHFVLWPIMINQDHLWDCGFTTMC